MEERWKPLIYGKLDLRDHLLVSDQDKSEKGYWIVSTTNGSRSAGSFREYFANPKRHTAGKHPITEEKLTWSFV